MARPSDGGVVAVLGHDPLLPLLALPPVALSFVVVVGEAYDHSLMLLLAIVSFAAVALSAARCFFGLGRRNEAPLFIFYVGLIFWFYYPGIATAASERQWHKAAAAISIDNSHAGVSFLATNLFVLFAALANQLTIKASLAGRLRRLLGAVPIPVSRRLLFLLTIAGVLSLGFYIVAAGGAGKAFDIAMESRRGDRPWAHEGYKGTSLSFLHEYFRSILIAVSAISLHLFLNARASLRSRVHLLVLSVVIIGLVGISSGTRSLLALMTFPPLILYFRRSMAERPGTKYRRLIILALLGLGVIIAADAQRKHRSGVDLGGVSLSIQDNDFFTQTAYAVAIQQQEKRYIHDSALVHIVTGPIPRVLWQGKPVMESMFVYTRYVWGFDTRETGGNTCPSLIGQYYMNWGWFGIFEIALVIGLLFRLADALFAASNRTDAARFGAVAVIAYLFIGFRMLSFAFFFPMATTVLLAAVASRWSWLRQSD